MNCIAMIPARYASTRFPAKLMQMLGNKTVIRHTYENTVKTGLFDQVMVVTDSQVIFDEIKGNGGEVMMSRKQHESGSDRIAEAVENLDVDIVVNVQGDEPFVQKAPLEKLLDVFKKTDGHQVQVASLMQVMKDKKNIDRSKLCKSGGGLKYEFPFFQPQCNSVPERCCPRLLPIMNISAFMHSGNRH